MDGVNDGTGAGIAQATQVQEGAQAGQGQTAPIDAGVGTQGVIGGLGDAGKGVEPQGTDKFMRTNGAVQVDKTVRANGATQTNGSAQADENTFQQAIAERDARIAELEAEVSAAAQTAEATEALTKQINDLKAQAEQDRLTYELKLAGVRNVKAACALLDDHNGDISSLKQAEPWLFMDEKSEPMKQTGKTGLPNAGASSDEGAQLKRWRALAGLDSE